MLKDRSRPSSPAPWNGPDTSDDAYNDGYDDHSRDDSDCDQESDDGTNNGANNDAYSPCLQLRFDHSRKNEEGFVLGTSRNCDIVLPKRNTLAGLAPRQCVITFDVHGRLILRDLQPRKLNNSGGTAVTYKDQGGQRRRSFTWILSGHRFTAANVPIRIHLHDNLSFRVVVCQHDISSVWYQQNVALFRSRFASSVNSVSLGGLGLKSLDSTAAPSGAQTPGTDAILLKDRELGRGAQAVVARVWDASTAIEYATKEPLRQHFHERLKREIRLLRHINHDCVVRCIPELSMMEPVPRLVLEYIPLGSLEDQDEENQISIHETFEVLRQGLSALRHLHERETPIVHRDIKPSNILVQSRTPVIHIKLSDFGFSGENEDYLKTCCGTPLYTAPEVFRGEPYNAAVDIWSLGVVVFQYAYGLP
ncbi:uncharacterized protein THITE_2046735, partial [Thermothielavioides terrestris NRRL 8126]